MIKEANVKVDGLTVIAGENDTGKSTLGRAYYYEVKKHLEEKVTKVQVKKNKDNMLLGTLLGFGLSLLAQPIVATASEYLLNNDEIIKKFDKNIKLKLSKDEKLVNSVIIETPYSLNNANYIKTTQLLANQRGLNYTLGDHIIDLILQMSQTPSRNINNIYENISNIIDGKIYYDSTRDDFFYQKDSIKKELDMNSTATGIKMFGFLQILLLNGTIKEGTVLILDEPEVHLHPKWQLKYAQVIVELVKKGIKVLITSHSPYMIEALQRYGKKSKIDMDFYLAENGIIDKIDNNNSATLSKIFEKLSEPFDIFDEMDSETLRNG